MIYKNTLEPFAVGYLNAAVDDIEYRMASGMLEQAKQLPLKIEEGALVAGDYVPRYHALGVSFQYGSNIILNEGALKQEIKDHPEFADELTDILEKMRGIATYNRIARQVRPYEAKLEAAQACWGGGGWSSGHGNPDYGLLLQNGTNGLRERVENGRRKNPGKDVFYDSLLMTLEAIDTYGRRYAKIAEDLAAQTVGEEKTRLERIAAALRQVPQQRPRDFFEACQLFWLVFTIDGIDSPGNFDQFMIDFYRKSAPADRQQCLEGMWQLFYKTRTWNLCISGSDEFGNDKSNELTYDILAVARKFRYNTPNLTMRVHKRTPEALWYSAAETIATGIGLPAIYNDECVCPALEALGVTSHDSHLYCMNGCNQIDIFGKSHMGLEDGEVCLAKCLEFALWNGHCGKTGELLSVQTGEASQFATYEELFAAYKKQVEYVTDVAIGLSLRTQRIVAMFSPNPHRSNLIEGCVEKGLDYANRGPLYGHGQILTEGLADAVDSLAALRHFVYETHTYTMSQVLEALKSNYEGYEEMHHAFTHYSKFGNAVTEVDDIYQAVIDHFYGYLETKATYRGGWFGGGCSTFNRAARYGGAIGALPNGRKNGDTLLADSLGAVPGCDCKGPTALLTSVMQSNQFLATSGNVMQLKFNRDLFNTETGIKAFIALAKTYFAGGKGQQLSINVVSLAELLDAQKNPQAHQNLIVRVGGYSEYFNRLDAGLQQNIIKRTELAL